ncbi:MAG: ATP-binding protein [Gammaproteobacteria bacterium]
MSAAERRFNTKLIWAPMVVGTLVLLLALTAWYFLSNQREATLRQVVSAQADSIEALIKQDLDSRITALARIADRWKTRGGTPFEEWRSDARNYIVDQPGYQAIEWVDTTFHVRWIVPLAGNEKARDLNLARETHRHAPMKIAKELGVVTLTSAIELAEGGKGFVVHIPVYAGGEFAGFILGVFKAKAWLDRVLAEVDESHYALVVSIEGEVIYSNHEHVPHMHAEHWGPQPPFALRGRLWRVSVWPTRELTAANSSSLPEIVLFVGAVLSVLMALTVHLARTARYRERKVQAVAQQLEQRTVALREARDAAEQGTRTKAAFLAAMSHEIRTPMNGVVGMIDLLGQTRLEDDQRQMLTTIKESAFSLLNIIDDILDFSKIEAGKLDLEYIPVSVRDIVEGVAETLTPSATKKGLDLFSFVDPAIPPRVLGEQVRLRQILFNVVGNAIKFTDEGNKIIIRADRVGGDGAAAKVRYQVIDQGIGIEADKLETLFQPFAQAESSTTRRFGGTGLGLTISKSLTDMMGGDIEVDSEPAVGSTFAVTLTHEIVEQAEEQTDIKRGLDDVRVLLVMEDEDRCEFIRRYLEHWHAEVEMTGDIRETKRLAREAAASGRPFHVIIQGTAWGNVERQAVRSAVHNEPALCGIRFVALRAGRTRPDQTDIIDAYTVEAAPLRRAAVLQAVAVAVGRASPEVSHEVDELVLQAAEAPTLAQAGARGELILVAEDNPVNQDVILRQLNSLGYAAEITADGRQAMAAWRQKPYALLLTDCHMPEMDGYELTAAIRDAERGTGRRTPIIAITANALQGEGEKCLEVGMDDYVTKPAELKKLKRVLVKWMPANVTQEQAEGSASSEATVDDMPIDLSSLRDCVGDDPLAHRDILSEFVGSTRGYIAGIHEAVTDGETGKIVSLAHAFKSAAYTVGAQELVDLSQGLERAGDTDDWEQIRKLVTRLDPAIEKVSRFVEHF